MKQGPSMAWMNKNLSLDLVFFLMTLKTSLPDVRTVPMGMTYGV
jgi:hypothetical protein